MAQVSKFMKNYEKRSKKDSFKLTCKSEGDEYVCSVAEYVAGNEVFYELTIDKPKNFAHDNEMEQPIMMRLDPETCQFQWYTVQDLGLEELEDKISRQLINRHL